MKSSKEIADTVFRIRDEYLERQRKRNIKIRRIASFCSAACLCAIVLVCANNMQLPSVNDWINPSADHSDFETDQDSTTIKIIASEEISEFPTTDGRNNEMPPESSSSTDIREENKNTEPSDNKNTITTSKSDAGGNNLKTTKHSGSQNTVTTRKPATGSVNNTKTTKHSGNQNTVTTRKPAASGVNNAKTTKHSGSQNAVTTRKPATNSENMKTTKHSGSQNAVATGSEDNMTNPMDPAPVMTTTHYGFGEYPGNETKPLTISVSAGVTTTIFMTAVRPQTTEVCCTTKVSQTAQRPSNTLSTLLDYFTEIYYNKSVYQNSEVSPDHGIDDNVVIDSYIGDLSLIFESEESNLVKSEVYKIKDIPIDYAVALKFEGYETYHIYYNKNYDSG